MADLMLGGHHDRIGLSLRKYEEQKVCEISSPSGPFSVFSGPFCHASLGREGIVLGVGDRKIRVPPELAVTRNICRLVPMPSSQMIGQDCSNGIQRHSFDEWPIPYQSQSVIFRQCDRATASITR